MIEDGWQKKQMTLVGLRHKLVSMLAPKLYSEWQLHYRERPMINFIKENYTEPLVGVEVGVHQGNNSLRILKTLNIEKLFLVDPYYDFSEAGLEGTLHCSEKDYEIALENVRAYLNKVTFIKKPSVEAANSFKNETVDFVYIDAWHKYEAVKQDIKTWYPKVKKGGVIGGHDFVPFFAGVVYASTEFAKESGLKLSFKGSDWWIKL